MGGGVDGEMDMRCYRFRREQARERDLTRLLLEVACKIFW